MRKTNGRESKGNKNNGGRRVGIRQTNGRERKDKKNGKESKGNKTK